MTYTEFKDWLITFMWKTGDTVLIANLDNLIRMANSALDRDLRVEDRFVSTTLPITDIDIDLPDDYKNMRSVSLHTATLNGPATYVEPAEMYAIRKYGLPNYHKNYSLIDRTLLLSGPYNPDDTDTVIVDYYRRIPDYAATDTSWVADGFLDVYTYCVLMQCAPFIREDERLQVWAASYQASMQSALEESQFYRARGISAGKPLPRQAGINRRRSGNSYNPR
jgi:hypothetical protein